MNGVSGFCSSLKILCTINEPQAMDKTQHKILFSRNKVTFDDSFKANIRLMCKQANTAFNSKKSFVSTQSNKRNVILYYIKNQLDATLAVLFINHCKITLHVSDAFCVHHEEYQQL